MESNFQQKEETGIFNQLQVDEISASHLEQTAKWSKFLAIVGFVFCGLAVLVSIFIGISMSLSSSFVAPGFGMGNAAIVFVYAGLALLYFFPCLYLFRFAQKMKRALSHSDQDSLISSLSNMKACFRFMGILTIVILGFYLLVILIAAFAAASQLL